MKNTLIVICVSILLCSASSNVRAVENQTSEPTQGSAQVKSEQVKKHKKHKKHRKIRKIRKVQSAQGSTTR